MALKEYNPSEVRIFFDGKELEVPVLDLRMAAVGGPGSESSKNLAAKLARQVEDRATATLEFSPLEGPDFEAIERTMERLMWEQDPMEEEIRREFQRPGAQASGLHVDLRGFHVPRIGVAVVKVPRGNASLPLGESLRYIWMVVVIFQARNVSTGLPDIFRMVREFPGHLTEDQLRPHVRRVVLDALTHEVDETLHINGERLTDPHPELRDRLDRGAALFHLEVAQGQALEDIGPTHGLVRMENPPETDVEFWERIRRAVR